MSSKITVNSSERARIKIFPSSELSCKTSDILLRTGCAWNKGRKRTISNLNNHNRRFDGIEQRELSCILPWMCNLPAIVNLWLSVVGCFAESHLLIYPYTNSVLRCRVVEYWQDSSRIRIYFDGESLKESGIRLTDGTLPSPFIPLINQNSCAPNTLDIFDRKSRLFFRVTSEFLFAENRRSIY